MVLGRCWIIRLFILIFVGVVSVVMAQVAPGDPSVTAKNYNITEYNIVKDTTFNDTEMSFHATHWNYTWVYNRTVHKDIAFGGLITLLIRRILQKRIIADTNLRVSAMIRSLNASMMPASG